MRNVEKDAVEHAKKRQAFLEHGFVLFSSKSIEAITLQDIANASGYGIATLYRYFASKARFAVEIAQWKWGEFFVENRKRRPNDSFEGMSAADMFEFFLDSFLELYKSNKDLLRFNQFLNIYIMSENVDEVTANAYRKLLGPVKEFFHITYEKAKKDHSLHTEISEKEMFSTTFHLMLAAITRYAGGLVYQEEGGFDEFNELVTLKELMMMKYTTIKVITNI